VTEIAGVWNLQRLGLLRPNETECVAADFHVAKGLGDCRHMTRGADIPRAVRGVMRVLFDGGGMRSVLRVGAVAGQADGVSRLAQHRLVVGAVWIVATETGDPARVHEALNEVIALHAVLVRGSVGKMREACFAELVIFESPKVRKVQSDVKADRPVVVLAVDRIGQGTPLRMTLDANIGRLNNVQASWIHDIGLRRLAHML